MGNKCCCKGRKKKEDLVSPALLTIREAQQKYLNHHIESDRDDSDEDSVDGLYGSLDSVNTLDSTDDSVTGCAAGGNISAENIVIGVDGAKNGVLKVQKVRDSTKDAVRKRREKKRLIRLSKRANFYSILNSEDKRARAVDPSMYQYPFENVVFEGGGNKGLAYCGCVRLLEDLKIWPQIKRIAGTSAGAMTAALLAAGYDSYDLEKFYSLNLNAIFLDHRFGYLSLLPNMLSSYGWNPGNKIYKWFGQKLQHKTGDPDVTFKELYNMTGRELCVVVTNLNQMTSLYCHPKTTPDMPIRLAVRMSLSIPGMFQAVKQTTVNGETDVFVDGGVLCNYPIHCFDGWWLSMKSEDSFLDRLQPLEDIPRLLERTERFGTFNEKTLGFQLYADNEQDLLKYQLENLRHGVELQDLPNTKLAREKIKKKKFQLKTDREHRRLVKAMNAFLRSLRRHNADKNDNINREELEASLEDEEYFPKKQRMILFGNVDSDVILEYLDKDQNGQISFHELMKFMEESGISMQNRFLGYQRRPIKNFFSYLDTLQATLLTNVKRVYVKDDDLRRTVGINTGHIGTSDFVLERADVEFVIERGRRSLEAFLKYHVATNNLPKMPEYRTLLSENRKMSKASMNSLADNDNIKDYESISRTLYCGTRSQIRKNDSVRVPLTSFGKNVRILDKVEVMNSSYDDGASSSLDEISTTKDKDDSFDDDKFANTFGRDSQLLLKEKLKGNQTKYSPAKIGVPAQGKEISCRQSESDHDMNKSTVETEVVVHADADIEEGATSPLLANDGNSFNYTITG